MNIHPRLLSISRTIHIYLTMLGLLVMVGFGITGFTANHEDWFGATEPRVSTTEGKTPTELIARDSALRIVEHVRSTFDIDAALSGYDDLDDRLALGFKAPGESWEVEIEKESGKTTAHQESFNTIAVLNNLHRGRYSGKTWSWVIDVSALLIVLACLTGFILWLALPRRRKVGLAALFAGTLATIAIVWIWVPGHDAPADPQRQVTSPDTNEPVATQPDQNA